LVGFKIDMTVNEDKLNLYLRIFPQNLSLQQAPIETVSDRTHEPAR